MPFVTEQSSDELPSEVHDAQRVSESRMFCTVIDI